MNDLQKHAAKQVVAALEVMLDEVNYTTGKCDPVKPTASALPREVIELCRSALKLYKTVNKEEQSASTKPA